MVGLFFLYSKSLLPLQQVSFASNDKHKALDEADVGAVCSCGICKKRKHKAADEADVGAVGRCGICDRVLVCTAQFRGQRIGNYM